MPDLFGIPDLPSNCKHKNVELILTPNLTHHGKSVCKDCGRFLAWVPKPETTLRQQENAKKIARLKASTLSEWERGFVNSIGDGRHLSPRQQEKLDAMARHA